MAIGQICARHVDHASIEETVQVAAQRMHNRKVGTLMVLNSERVPIGIITDRDLTVRVLAEGRDPFTTTVGDVMTPAPKTVHEEATLEEALTVMRSGPFRRIGVVDSAGKLVGLLSLDDILDTYRREFNEIGELLERESPTSLKDEL